MSFTLYSKEKKTYNSRYSLVVSDPTTNPPLAGLTRGEQTGSRTLPQVWSYVVEGIVNGAQVGAYVVVCQRRWRGGRGGGAPLGNKLLSNINTKKSLFEFARQVKVGMCTDKALDRF